MPTYKLVDDASQIPACKFIAVGLSAAGFEAQPLQSIHSTVSEVVSFSSFMFTATNPLPLMLAPVVGSNALNWDELETDQHYIVILMYDTDLHF